MKIFTRSAIIAAIIAVPLIQSCSTDECEENKNSLPLAGFYDGSSPLQAVALDSVQIIGEHVPGGESALSGTATGTSQIYLPFRVDSDTTTYLLIYRQRALLAQNLSDTIRFVYDRVPFFVSKACGAIYKFRINEIYTSHTFIDSVVCPLGTIDNAAIENLRIYFKVAHNDEEDDQPEV